MNRKALWITQTAILLTLLIAVQAVTAGFGNTFITGSLVNLILIVSVVIAGLSSGLAVALLSPLFAYFFGIGPIFWQIVVCIAIGNALLVFCWSFIVGKKRENSLSIYLVATIVAALFKFTFLYFAIVKFVVPVVLQMPEPQAKIVSAAFSYPQLITAVIGGILATMILPMLTKALKRN
ncbi:ECF transporter S component [Enterococcus rivorum]|uniref:ECF transporter S component n=1 Tax=Enterococcus rivorum TaxID=762845 RepID=A0A1E5KW64_9ENTE|nr:ECF transporter S component [Enterococcus rivorum]MBP2100063.1 hypothetical protein [Enterococcus rivorum]OEH82110.1 ECF transporter S component [Enterococcus rivorum]